jgi:hypothetical protein
MERKSLKTPPKAVPKKQGRSHPAAKPKSKLAKPKPASKSVVPIDELSAWIGAILPQATIVRKPSGAMYQAGTKIFAFTRPEGVALKLPEPRIEKLVESRDASFLVMGTKTMREWALVRYQSPGEYLGDAKLFEEAMRFVASLVKGGGSR